MNYCPNCGAKATKNARFCGECGQKLDPNLAQNETSVNVCPGCAYTSTGDEAYCPNCGTVLFKQSGSKKKSEGISSPMVPASMAAREPISSPPLKQKKSSLLGKLGKVLVGLLAIAAVAIAALYFIGDNLDSPVQNDPANESFQTIRFEKPKHKEVIAEGVLTEDNLVLESKQENVKMTVSPFCLEGETPAKIQSLDVPSPFENITMRGYDFTVGKGGHMDGVVKIEMPYSESTIPDGFTARQCISAAHYNEEEGVYEAVNFTLDTLQKKLVVLTTELSPIVEIMNLKPGEAPIANGTPNLGSSQVFTANDSWVSGGDWGIFYLTNEGSLWERTYKYNFEVAKNTFQEVGGEAIAQKIAKFGLADMEMLTFDASLSLFGTIGYKENFGKTVLLLGKGEAYDNFFKSYGFTGASLEKKTKVLGRIGVGLALIQLIYDLNYKQDHTLFRAVKGFVYGVGDEVLAWVLKKEVAGAVLLSAPAAATVGTLVTGTLIALFVTEQILGPIETWNDDQYSKMQEHTKLFSAYNKYYQDRNGKEYRTYKEWLVIIKELNKEALSAQNVPAGMDRDTYFESLLKKELLEYTNKFWKIDLNERINLVINSPSGYVYGDWGAIHYAGNKNDKEKSVATYLDEIANGKYPGMDLTLVERYLVSTKGNVVSTINYADNARMAKQYLQRFDEAGTSTSSQSVVDYAAIKKELGKSMYNYLMENRIRPLMQHEADRIYLEQETALRGNLDALSKDLNSVITVSVVDKSKKIDGESPFAYHILVPKSPSLNQSGKLEQWKIVLDEEGQGSLAFTTLAYIKSEGFKQFELFLPDTKDFGSSAKSRSIKVLDFLIEDQTVTIELNEEVACKDTPFHVNIGTEEFDFILLTPEELYVEAEKFMGKRLTSDQKANILAQREGDFSANGNYYQQVLPTTCYSAVAKQQLWVIWHGDYINHSTGKRRHYVRGYQEKKSQSAPAEKPGIPVGGANPMGGYQPK